MELENILDHRLLARRAVDMQRRIIAKDPTANDEMVEVDVMIGMVMGDKEVIDLRRPDPTLDELVDDSGTAIDEDIFLARANYLRRSTTVRIWRRNAGAEKGYLHYFCSRPG